MIPHSRPIFGQPFVDAVQQVVASGQIAMGGKAAELEALVASCTEREEAVAVDSGTAAITLALRALSEKQSVTRVGIPAYVCSSVLYAVQAAGCEPVCMDCGDDLHLIPETALKQAESLNVVVLVHPFGMVEPLATASWPCPVIEDIAQAPGAGIEGCPVGSFGDVAIASFYATKPWGGAYGGIVLTDDPELANSVRTMRDPDGATELHHYAGHHQLSDLHAAMAIIRIGRADEEMAARQVRATVMDGWFGGGPVKPVRGLHQGNLYRYLIRTEGDAEQWIDTMHSRGVMAMRPVASPVSSLLETDAPGASAAWRDVVSLPLLADASEAEMEKMHGAVDQCMS